MKGGCQHFPPLTPFLPGADGEKVFFYLNFFMTFISLSLNKCIQMQQNPRYTPGKETSSKPRVKEIVDHRFVHVNGVVQNHLQKDHLEEESLRENYILNC